MPDIKATIQLMRTLSEGFGSHATTFGEKISAQACLLRTLLGDYHRSTTPADGRQAVMTDMFAASEEFLELAGAFVLTNQRMEQKGFEFIDQYYKDWQLEQANTDREVHALNDPAVRRAVFDLSDGRCTYCDCELPTDNGQAELKDKFCIEHVVPSSKGGPDNLVNYVASCWACNTTKHDRHVLWMIKRMLPAGRAQAAYEAATVCV